MNTGATSWYQRRSQGLRDDLVVPARITGTQVRPHGASDDLGTHERPHDTSDDPRHPGQERFLRDSNDSRDQGAA